jgi:hypothetical protein
MLVSLLMAVAGVILLLIRYGRLQLAVAEGWEEEYYIKPVAKPVRARARTTAEIVSSWNADKEANHEDGDELEISEPVKKKPAAKAETAKKATTRKTAAKKPVTKRKSS